MAQFPFLYQPPPSTRGNESGQTGQLGNLTHWEIGEERMWKEILTWVPQTKFSVSHLIVRPQPLSLLLIMIYLVWFTALGHLPAKALALD